MVPPYTHICMYRGYIWPVAWAGTKIFKFHKYIGAALVCDLRAKYDPQQPTSSLAYDLHLKVR